MLPSHDRFPYSGIDTRAKYAWPEGKRLALYIAINIEHFPFGVDGGIDLDRETKPWSQRSWLWREYGNRVGGWRLAELFDELGINVGVIVNSENYAHCPELIERYRRRGDETIGHGTSNGTERPIDMSVETERHMVGEVTATMTRADGARPVGWMTPYLTPSLATTDLLIDHGYSYVLDWGMCDEQPFWVKGGSSGVGAGSGSAGASAGDGRAGRDGRILALPYPIELNDQPAIVGRRHTAADYADMLVDQFDEMSRRAVTTPLVFAMSLHTFIVGQPFRIVHLRRALEHMRRHSDNVWWTLPKTIAGYYGALPAEVQLGVD
ncbi:MAG: polysaccharide deacetylase [Proteobacteria bacterium]|nr:polysaccharide deacetylase [Burkholderiales bacterium]